MKRRVLIFLALFGLGLAVLLWLSSRRGDGRAPTPTETAPGATSERSGEPIEVRDAEGQKIRGASSGPLDAFFKDEATKKLVYRVVARDHRSVGAGAPGARAGAYEFTDLRIEYHERESGDLESEAKAARARATLADDVSRSVIDERDPIELEEVEATLHRGSRFAPLRLAVPKLRGFFGARRFTSQEDVHVEGRGLTIDGHGLDFDGVAETLRVESAPRARVELGGGARALISSRDGLTIESRPDLGADALVITARDGARMSLEETRDPMVLESDELRLFGTLAEGEGARFVPTRAEAEGRVTLRPQQGTFAGERAIVEFDAAGRARTATLDGAPTVDLALRGEELEPVPPELLVEGETLTVGLSGAGPLEVFFEERERFEFNGPAEVALPAVEARLLAAGGIGGVLGPDQSFHALDARGETRLVYQGAELETVDLAVRAVRAADGELVVRASAAGATRSHGTLTDWTAFDLMLRGGGEIERSRTRTRVIEGRGVELSARGERPFTASAHTVRDFDVEALAFVATGGVAFENELGRGRGDALVARGPRSGELYGSPARLEAEQGSFDARAIEFDEQRVLAVGEVTSAVTVGGVRYALASSWASLARDVVLEGERDGVALLFDAAGAVHGTVVRARERLDLACRLVRATAELDANGDYAPTGLVARGGVEFAYGGELDLRGSGERLEVAADGSGRLFPAEGERALLSGTLPSEGVVAVMSATFVDFSLTRLVAENVDADIDGLSTALGGAEPSPAERRVRAVAGRMACDETSILMSESVFVGGHSDRIGDWSLDAQDVLFSTTSIAEARGIALEDVTSWGGVKAELGEMGSARARSVQLVGATGRLTLIGSPAQLDQSQASWSSDRFELDLKTSYVRAGAGEVHGVGPAEGSDWTLRYASLEPIPTEDEAIQVLREPVLVSGDGEIRANWALVWLDVSEWRRLTGQPFDPSMPPPPVESPRPRRRAPKSLFGSLDATGMAAWLREVYLDGEVELRQQGERKLRAEGAYLDLVDGHGWVREADLAIDVPFGDRTERIKIQADWLRHSRDGSLTAVNAVGTTCTHDSPHYVIQIGDLEIKPRFKQVERPPRRGETEPRVVERPDGWDVSMQNNALAFGRGVALPLPRLDVPVEKNLDIDVEKLSIAELQPVSFGQDSKLGAFISTSVSSELGAIAKNFHRILSFGRVKLPPVEGRTSYRASYLGSRGGLAGLDSTIESPDLYHLDLSFDAIYDRGEDRGLVRVDEADRDELRAWLRARGRYLLDDRQWLDVVVARQSDAAVQSEFFESDFLRYEERESYLHWRRARGVDYWSATAELEPESFRTETVSEPSLGFFRGRAEIGDIAGRPLVYTSRTSLDHLRRVEGDPRYEAPFADGLGEREVLRFDSSQRVETPLDLGALGARLVPFVEGRGTVWDRNAADDGEAGRVALIAGAELSTTMWKRFEGGAQHAWSPSIAVRGDVVHDESGTPVAAFDALELPVEGRFVDLGLRSRWEHRERKNDLDIELRQTYADATAPGEDEGWLPLAMRSTWLSQLRAMPFGVTHEALYDLEHGETDYSRTFVGLEPLPSLGFDVGYHTARDDAGAPLYGALSLGARYDFHAKWEFEGRETLSTRDDGKRLSSSLLLRRLGHDFVLETEIRFVAGEGSTSIKFNVVPLFAWKRPNVGLLDRWRSSRE